ncbi:recombinase rad51 [Perkinsus olseni]|uniref:Recombinase rad51 n=1 Tax=Perkinsus olseni TaxID=32597 RepID=A0A7J6MEF1_PEROL|nr:recombinase rad51 [Perkinsus olseni]
MQVAAPGRTTRTSARLRKRGKTASSGTVGGSADVIDMTLLSAALALPVTELRTDCSGFAIHPVAAEGSSPAKARDDAFESCVAEAARASEKSSPSSTPTAKRVRLDASEHTGKGTRSAPGLSRRRESTSTVATTPGLRLGSPRNDEAVKEREQGEMDADVGACDGPMLLDRLRAPEKDGGAGLTTADIQKLIDQGIGNVHLLGGLLRCARTIWVSGTVEALAFAPIRHLSSLRGVSDQKAEKLKKAAVTLGPVIRLPTLMLPGPSIDALLQGGVETGSITEIFGESRSGKSQFCHALCVAAQLPVSQGGAAGRSLYIDTEGTFRPERLADMGQKWGLDRETVLSNVAFARAYNSDHQQQLLLDAASVMSASRCRYALVVVDSVTNLLRSEFQGRGELAERQQILGRLLRMLQRIADEYGVAVVLTNQVVANVDPGPSMFTNPANATKPIGGNILAHSSQTRLQLRKGQASEKRKAELWQVGDAYRYPMYVSGKAENVKTAVKPRSIFSAAESFWHLNAEAGCNCQIFAVLGCSGIRAYAVEHETSMFRIASRSREWGALSSHDVSDWSGAQSVYLTCIMILKVYDSPCLPESECAFSITANGLAEYIKPQRDNYDQDKKGFK